MKKTKNKIVIAIVAVFVLGGAFMLFTVIGIASAAITVYLGEEETEEETGDVYLTEGMLNNPCPKYVRISSPYGWRTHPVLGKVSFHSGIDMAASTGAPIVAAEDGVVVASSYSGSYGNRIIIQHEGKVWTLYAHASRLIAKEGQEVKRGEEIAKVGSTGRSTGPHLHFEVRVNANLYGNAVNPVPYLDL